MLIGIDASRANRKFKGGTEWYSYYLIRELAKIDRTNQYILYSDRPLVGGLANLKDDGQLSAPGKINYWGWQEIKSPHNNFRVKVLYWPFKFFWTQLRLSLEMLIFPPEVLFISAHTLPLIHPKKSIVTIHDIGFAREKQLYSLDDIGPAGSLMGVLLNFFIKLFTGGKFGSNVLDYHSWSTKFALKHAKKIIAVSEFTKQELIDVYGAAQAKIEVVYNGYNQFIYKKINDQAEIEKILNKYEINVPYIFYVGRLEKKKNTATLVQAYAVMRQKYKNIKHKLVLAGNASLGFDEVKYVIEEFDLNNDVIMTGWIPESDMPFIFNGASVFVFPSLYEGFGIPLLQAMASEVPIAASDIAPIVEVSRGAALLFNPKDKNDIAEKMARLIANKKLAENLVNLGRNRVKDFSLDSCAKKTLSVIESLKVR
jgi:glycosyltransferase involved in cell wall biosynthesis